MAPEFEISSKESWVDEGYYDLVIRIGGSANVVQVSMPPADADALAAELQERLQPHFDAMQARAAARRRANDTRRAAEDEAARPAREKAARELQEAVSRAPRVEAGKCPACGDVAHLGDYDEPGYECSSDSSTGRGSDGRRCDQCNKFRARVADQSCPACEAPLEDGPDAVVVADVPGHGLVEIEEVV